MTVLVIAAFHGCAVVGTPDGGAYDETPPSITGSSPKDGATGVGGHKVSIEFDEFIKIENASEKVVVSPPQIEQPEIKVNGKRIQVELFDSLKPNTTYTIDFADGIVDNNEGNPLGDYCFRFSTGDVIDSLEVSGYVLNAMDLEPLKGMTVGVHSDLADSSFTTKVFERISRTDDDGHFTIRGLSPGKYRIYAVKDMDQTFGYSQRNEQIAWLDSVIVPSSELRYRNDTVFNDDLSVDTVLTVPYIRYMPDDITLLAFKAAPNQQYLTKYERAAHEKFTLQFAMPLDSMPLVKGLDFDESDAYIVQHTARYDTLTFWMKDTAVYYNDTLSISLTYLATDTAGVLVPTTDTLRLVPKKSRARILKDAARRAEEDAKQLEKDIKRLERLNDSIGLAKLLAPKTKFLAATLTQGASMSVADKVTLQFQEPVTFLSDSVIQVYKKSDSLWVEVPFLFEQDSLDIFKYNILAEWRPDETFRIDVDSAQIIGLYGLHNNRMSGELKFDPLDKYSTLTVNVANPKPGYTVMLLNPSGKTVRQGVLKDGSVDFFFLKPGQYYVAMFNDVNRNGVWDTGEYENRLQPEDVWYISKDFTLKADWYHETEIWNVSETPRFRQKPENLIKQKGSKKQKDIHSKNVERMEKKADLKAKEEKKKADKKRERQERRQKNKENR